MVRRNALSKKFIEQAIPCLVETNLQGEQIIHQDQDQDDGIDLTTLSQMFWRIGGSVTRGGRGRRM